ncbi:hypothetical protein KVT40_005539 [Elsinoe batatas]|uniref:Uncharacterized protein n=1 Tax=Elsinoe batatas TaxID=2601811 RepID=A0A8K0PIF9_9PEZI|nr:hypothetical protein KVT40_005539 [Elsinoe batatas]
MATTHGTLLSGIHSSANNQINSQPPRMQPFMVGREFSGARSYQQQADNRHHNSILYNAAGSRVDHQRDNRFSHGIAASGADESELFTQAEVPNMMDSYQPFTSALQQPSEYPLMGDANMDSQLPASLLTPSRPLETPVALASNALQSITKEPPGSRSTVPIPDHAHSSEIDFEDAAEYSFSAQDPKVDRDGVAFTDYERPKDGGASLLDDDLTIFSNAVANGEDLSIEDQAYFASLQLRFEKRRTKEKARSNRTTPNNKSVKFAVVDGKQDSDLKTTRGRKKRRGSHFARKKSTPKTDQSDNASSKKIDVVDVDLKREDRPRRDSMGHGTYDLKTLTALSSGRVPRTTSISGDTITVNTPSPPASRGRGRPRKNAVPNNNQHPFRIIRKSQPVSALKVKSERVRAAMGVSKNPKFEMLDSKGKPVKV